MNMNLFNVIKGVVHVEGAAALKAVYWICCLKTRDIREQALLVSFYACLVNILLINRSLYNSVYQIG